MRRKGKGRKGERKSKKGMTVRRVGRKEVKGESKRRKVEWGDRYKSSKDA